MIQLSERTALCSRRHEFGRSSAKDEDEDEDEDEDKDKDKDKDKSMLA
jgi:hypothetical protein